MRADCCWQPIAGGIRLSLHVLPGARREGFEGFERDAGGRSFLRLAVRAPAIEDRANRRVIEILARALDLPRRDLALRAGAAGRWKTLDIRGDIAYLTTALSALIAKVED